MSDILKSYSDLSSTTPRFQVAAVLESVVQANPFALDQHTRAALLRFLLKDLKAADAAQALLAVKTLGRIPAGSEPLTEPTSISILLDLATKQDRSASTEALKCIANTMLLYDHARATFVSSHVGGAQVCATMLEKATAPDQIFILSRILFLATAFPSSLVLSLVQDKRRGRTVVDLISMKIDISLASLLNNKYLAHEALSELLKFAFNLLHHYPKLSTLGSKEYKSPELDGLLPPLLRVYQSLPPTFPIPLVSPLTHVIHALVTIPITPSLLSLWFSSTTSPTHRHLHRSPSTSSSSSRAIDRVIAAGRRSLSITSASSSSHSIYGISYPDTILRTLDLLDLVFLHYFPSNSNPDSTQIRESFKNEMAANAAATAPSSISPFTKTAGATMMTLDELVSPLVALCTRICMMDKTQRVRVRESIIPPTDMDIDIDSEVMLVEERPDFLGRCVRLLRSVYHPRLKAEVGEMLFAACDCDPSMLASLVGYGNVAGFLFNKGILAPPPPPKNLPSLPHAHAHHHHNHPRINPITGRYEPAPSGVVQELEMTEEEKEEEMDRLFVLFDRLDKLGGGGASGDSGGGAGQKYVGGGQQKQQQQQRHQSREREREREPERERRTSSRKQRYASE
ncbi:hypothetical protein D9757_007588 [Collybiopsis confluens]|uniref:Uncharacterized protein n=1 Tax=Collybiopsis confluens TaxID=2823264 RepID=A0A8H5M5X8_9AGAR|nr:hypothetical protein D9757_007588 [Collybiopsis confluens]